MNTSRPPISEWKLGVTAYPNPYNDYVRFTINTNITGHGVLEVYNMLGQKIQTVFSGQVFGGGKPQVIEYKVPVANRTNLVYILRVGEK
ncbi:MAG: T9SS type A sorting domain-containing protein, partial [Bacteroidota bacterium]|nr:T9SS type A sorting domain-containing protein [Bacteroidota bacterium]